VDRTAVTSSAIRAVGYDPETATLEIEFTSGTVYQYAGVPSAVHAAFMTAPSHGRYFDAHIRNAGYAYRRITP